MAKIIIVISGLILMTIGGALAYGALWYLHHSHPVRDDQMQGAILFGLGVSGFGFGFHMITQGGNY